MNDTERQVLRLLARHGLCDKDIAACLYLSPRTVRTNIMSLLRRFGVTNRTAPAVHAHRAGIVRTSEIVLLREHRGLPW
jgi:DNA-binding NarL/FixJ family response regulator